MAEYKHKYMTDCSNSATYNSTSSRFHEIKLHNTVKFAMSNKENCIYYHWINEVEVYNYDLKS